ncbi:TipJ family phage tail tip protein [Adonisia turfae]|nr:phage tail protein [Adonisia turfae]
MVDQYPLSGRGGGGRKQRKPKTQDAGNPSDSYAQVVEILSAGPCRGVRTIRDVFLDGTPLENLDGSRNFSDLLFQQRAGRNVEAPLQGFGTYQSSETGVGVEVKNSQFVTRTFSNDQIDAVIVRFGVALERREDDGDVKGNAVRVQIFVQQGIGPFVLRYDRTINDRFPQIREFEAFIPVTIGVRDFSIRMVKASPDIDEGDQTELRQLRWQSYQEIITTSPTYPNLHVVAMQFGAEQFNSAPRRSYRIGGMIGRILIPNNMRVAVAGITDSLNPLAGGLDPILGGNGQPIPWNGRLVPSPQPTSDPAWIALFLLTDPMYGYGSDYSINDVDLMDLAEISAYNNPKINSGLGYLERRFRLSTLIQTEAQGFKHIDDVLSNCNAHRYFDGEKMRFWQDRPGTPKFQFTNADVVDGSFTYASSDLNSRYSVALVTWHDPDDQFKPTVEPVELEEAFAVYGYRETKFAAYGCYSRSQAVRAGLYQLVTNFYETDTINFQARGSAAGLRPGQLFTAYDNRYSSAIAAGLLLNASVTELQLDRTVTIPGGTVHVEVITPSGEIERRLLANNPGSADQLIVTTAFSAAPVAGASWAITTVPGRIWRCLTINSEEGDLSTIEVFGSIYLPDKEARIEQGIPISPQEIPGDVAPAVASPPFNINVVLLVLDSGSYVLQVSWQPPADAAFVSGYILEYKRGQFGQWQSQATTQGVSYDFQGVLYDPIYQVRVASLLSTGKFSNWAEGAYYEAEIEVPSTVLSLLSRAVVVREPPKANLVLNYSRGASAISF